MLVTAPMEENRGLEFEVSIAKLFGLPCQACNRFWISTVDSPGPKESVSPPAQR